MGTIHNPEDLIKGEIEQYFETPESAFTYLKIEKHEKRIAEHCNLEHISQYVYLANILKYIEDTTPEEVFEAVFKVWKECVENAMKDPGFEDQFFGLLPRMFASVFEKDLKKDGK